MLIGILSLYHLGYLLFFIIELVAIWHYIFTLINPLEIKIPEGQILSFCFLFSPCPEQCLAQNWHSVNVK